MNRRFYYCAVVVLGLAFAACMEESPNPVVFDQVLQSTTVRNRLLTPVIIFRNGAAIDTLEARTDRSYPLGQKGVFRHAWRILAPLGIDGKPAGIEPTGELGIQYAINAEYTIEYDDAPGGTIFTPRIANLTGYDLNLTANYQESDEFRSTLVIPRNQNIPLTHSPYFYWNSNSNIVVDAIGGPGVYYFKRDTVGDHGTSRYLQIDDSTSSYKGAGVTMPLVAF
ncbi:MAG: hypothetical protein IPM61_03045 [Chlorobi bacterium]|nr:MAG: hypothetical protein UZ07_CHB004000862 [Chlorobi bacterium OLB7]MBK8910282.1 hypothetical protein [Chlorobiota bacterium]MBX7217402.1 hypothetical protein [Candidatus Kapabacteria bacterium]